MSTTNVETQDIVLAAALKVLGYRLDGVDIIGAKGLFHFSGVPADFVRSFDLGNVRVEPVAFNSAIKALTTAVRRQHSRG